MSVLNSADYLEGNCVNVNNNSSFGNNSQTDISEKAAINNTMPVEADDKIRKCSTVSFSNRKQPSKENHATKELDCVISDDESDVSEHLCDVYGDGEPPEVKRHREQVRSYKMAVVRRLLEEFSLEGTLEHYRGLAVREYRVDVNQFSSQCVPAAIALQQRLIKLTGSDVIRMNDPKYMDELRRKRQEEYEARMDREEEERAEKERARMRRMLKEGSISMEELKEDPLFLAEYNKNKLKYGRTRPTRPKRGPSKTQNKQKRAQTASVTEGRSKHLQEERQSKNATPLGYKDTPPPSHNNKKTQERPRTVHWESRHDRLRYTEEQNHVDDENLDFSRWSGYNKYNDPLIIKLQDEQTVDGLYDIAEEILDGILPSQRGYDKEKKKTT